MNESAPTSNARHPTLRSLVEKPSWISAAALALTGVLLFARTVLELFSFSQNQGSSHYSHFMLIPLIACYLGYSKRRDLLAAIRDGSVSGPGTVKPAGRPSSILTAIPLLILAPAGALYVLGISKVATLSLNDYLALMTASMLLYSVAAFIWVFGRRTFRVVKFPLLFLVFIVPIPEFLLQSIVVALQVASTSVVDVLFRLTGTVYMRDGFFFSLPGLTIQVAEQCSGIRSSLSLLIVSILAAHVSLRTRWGKAALVLAVFPITVFKNGVRIVLLSLLAIHWDPAIMRGSLHSSGGIPFFVVAMTLLGLVLLAIRKFEATFVISMLFCGRRRVH